MEDNDHENVPKEGISAAQIWVPEVDEDFKPVVGKTTFTSVDDAFAFYNRYANAAGFSVRKASNKYNKEHQEIWKMFVCSNEGKTDDKVEKMYGEVKRRRSVTREECKALMTIKKLHEGPNYVVLRFVEEHNHDLATPRKKHLLRSHRKLSNAQKSLRDSFNKANISASQTMAVMEIELSGFQNIGCIERDVRNYERDKRKETEGHDAQLLIEHFREMVELNPNFVFEVKVDEKNQLTDCFWADQISCKAYHYFGDVVVFDTTYGTNRYEMIFAPFTGVNHHGQLIILGCGFIHNETTESFIWLFEKWRQAMQGEPPKAIITDQDPAMTKAIATVLPTTFHRYCIWHILQKMFDKLGHVAYKKEFSDPFNHCIWNSETPEEFEELWKNVTKENGLEENDWLASLFSIREKWVPVYLRPVFFAGMSSSQRSESMNSFFRKYVSKKNSLMEFIARFDRAIARQRHNELIADHETISSKPKLKTPFLMERELGETYTRVIFYKFQIELFESTAYMAELMEKNESHCLYIVGRIDEPNNGRQVVFDIKTKQGKCSCLKFEFEGIPCRHILCVLRACRISNLPNHYILRRWTKHAKTRSLNDKISGEAKGDNNEPLSLRYSDLSHISGILVSESAELKNTYDLCRKGLYDLIKQVQELKVGMEATLESKPKEQLKEAKELVICEPTQARTKGSGKRLISKREKAIKKAINKTKGRRCNGCGLIGPGHDKRNCPALKKDNTNSDIDMYEEQSDDDVESFGDDALHSFDQQENGPNDD